MSALSTAPAAALPESVLLPYQKAWIEDDSDLKIAEKSRRTGLTWGEAADAALQSCGLDMPAREDHPWTYFRIRESDFSDFRLDNRFSLNGDCVRQRYNKETI